MTPAARVQSAIEILDVILQGNPVEQSLIRWARGNRFAGSKDRAAIRDHVYAAIRCRRSFAALGGGLSGRGLMVGAFRSVDADLTEVFSGAKYAPDALTTDEQALTGGFDDLGEAIQSDLPDWLWERFQASHAEKSKAIASCLRDRAKVYVRVNTRKASVQLAQTALLDDAIETSPHALSSTSLELLSNPRRLAQSKAYETGLVEIQDVASQAVCDFLDVPETGRILDYCAGGGGKSLAITARTSARVVAHDANAKRMADIPNRMKKAGQVIEITNEIDGSDRFDLVFCDVPCSGSGSWRRDPEGKWILTLDKLAQVTKTQAEILDTCASLVAADGELAYATCSVLREENQTQIDDFCDRHPNWRLVADRQFLPTEGGDGFYVARLTRA